MQTAERRAIARQIDSSIDAYNARLESYLVGDHVSAEELRGLRANIRLHCHRLAHAYDFEKRTIKFLSRRLRQQADNCAVARLRA